jgi:hypothetical protein
MLDSGLAPQFHATIMVSVPDALFDRSGRASAYARDHRCPLAAERQESLGRP